MAERDLSAGVAAAVVSSSRRPVWFFEGEFAGSSMLRLWNGIGNFSWDGKTWTGAGGLIAISPIEEKSAIEALGFSITIDGLKDVNLSLALQSAEQGRAGTVWLGFLDPDNELVDDPYMLVSGKLDVPYMDDDAESCRIRLDYESRLIDLFKPRERRYTNEDQKLDHPEDTGFRYVESLQDVQLVWGGPVAAASPVAQPSTEPAISGGDWGGDGGNRGRSQGDG